MARRKRSLFKIPRKFISLKGDQTIWWVLGIGGAAAVWYFGINESTRQFDLLGMIKGGGSGSVEETIINNNEPVPDLSPIDVVDQIQPSNAEPFPQDAEESQLNTVSTISGAYRTRRSRNARFSQDIVPITILGVD